MYDNKDTNQYHHKSSSYCDHNRNSESPETDLG